MKRWISSLFLAVFCAIQVQGSAVTFDQLTAQHSADVIRLAKSQEIRRYMNETADPCENFYEFACGNWSVINPATSMENPTTGFMVTLLQALDLKLRHMLLVTEDDKDTEADKSVKNFYQSCLNIEPQTLSYAAQLKEIVKEFGEMPAWEDGNWREEDFDWRKTVAAIAHRYDIKLMVEFSVGMAAVDKSKNSLFIDQPSFQLPSKSLYLDEGNAKFLQEYRSDVAFNLKRFLDMDEAKAQNTAKEIVDFEISLVKGMVDSQLGLQFRKVYTRSGIRRVHRKYSPSLNLKQQINITLGTLPALKVYTNEGYIENLIVAVQNAPKKVVANYIFYQLMQEFIVQLPESAIERREHSCMTTTKTYFIKSLDGLMYRNFSTPEMDKGIEDIFQGIKSVFRSDLAQSPKLQWISDESCRSAVQKLNAMKLEFVAKEQPGSTTALPQLSLTQHDYIENLKALLALKACKQRDKLAQSQPTSIYDDFWSPTPYYMFEENVVKIPASILLPFYTWSSAYPPALNFGMLGSMLAHEIMHGFDQTGSAYDAEGNQRAWWDSDSAQGFKDRSKCFMQQYHKYIFGGEHLPAAADQGENIADNGGIRLAYEAFLKLSEDSDMPGLLHFSHQQLFFISYAHMWCSDTFSGFRIYQTLLDDHVPAEFRVVGPLSNLKAFAEAYNCPKGSGMNPIDKCELY